MKNRRAPRHERERHFIALSIAKFHNKFDYSLVEYTNNHTPVRIICPIHGEFQQRPQNHLDSKEGCYQCGKARAGRNHRLSKEEFIRRSNIVHSQYYDYSKVEYIDSFTPVIVTCPIHGDFTQQPNDHMFHGNGCKQCGYENRMSKGEQKIATWLEQNNMEHRFQYSFDDLKANDGINSLRYDFFLPNEEMLIEFDGPHHEQPITYAGTGEEKAERTHLLTVEYDRKKEDYAKENGYTILRIPYNCLKEIEEVLSSNLL